MENIMNRKRLYVNGCGGSWSQASLFSHPFSFETLALAPCLKNKIQDDLKKFVNGGEFYTRVGKAWKRGYLLYGPPGTGKTSLIAAIANYLEFDVYQLELTSVSSKEVLRELLISTSSKSIIVVEHIDCSIYNENREKEKKCKRNSGNSVSLSDVLKFLDGLWSPCAGGRLIIFTANHKEKLDPALLNRIDEHILLSYCDMESFKVLARNYLKIEEHESMKEVEVLLRLVKITPADVAECLMSFDEDPGMGMKNVVEELKKRLHSKKRNKEKDTKKKSGSDIKKKQKAKKKESESSGESVDSSDDESTGSDVYESAELHFTDETMMAMKMMAI